MFSREQTVQVNALSTALLGDLFLRWMQESSVGPKNPSHLVFLTSRDHLYADVSKWSDWAASEGILRHLNDPSHWPDWLTNEKPNYANSKLIAMYAIDEFCRQALGSDGK